MAGRPTTDDFTARARLFGGNRMKLGVMAFNCSHGSTITTVPEAWKLDWADTVAIAQAVDQSGMEALLPVGRWRGYGGPSDFNSTTFESFTWASALGARTGMSGRCQRGPSPNRKEGRMSNPISRLQLAEQEIDRVRPSAVVRRP